MSYLEVGKMAKKKIFVSFDYDRDKHYKRLLEAWDANNNFDFKFSDQSITEPINSSNASVIKAGITKKLSSSTHLLVLVGQFTYTSEWVCWEIDKAKELGLKIIGVKINNSYISPSPLLNCGAKWARSFNQESILSALEVV